MAVVRGEPLSLSKRIGSGTVEIGAVDSNVTSIGGVIDFHIAGGGSDYETRLRCYLENVLALQDNAALELDERSDPSAPSSNKGRLYLKDNGSGKTQLCIRFASGAVQVIATEP